MGEPNAGRWDGGGAGVVRAGAFFLYEQQLRTYKKCNMGLLPPFNNKSLLSESQGKYIIF